MQSIKVLLSGRTDNQYEELLKGLSSLHEEANGPLRLEKEFNVVKKNWVVYVRARTWSEFFYEFICTYPEEKAEIRKEVLNALEHAFRPMIAAARGAAFRESNEQPQEEITQWANNSESRYEGTLDDEDHADRLPPNAVKKQDNSAQKVQPSDYVQILEALLDTLKWKALGVKPPVDKAREKMNASVSSESPNLSADMQFFDFTQLSALDFVANNVIVGSVNALKAGKNNPGSSSSLKRAISAFKKEWNGAKLKCRLPYPVAETVNSHNLPRDKIALSQASLIPVNGLEHIENLICIPDDVRRNHESRFKGFGRAEWKDFYLAGCKTMRGSIVRELYPSFYAKDEMNSGKMIPYYSDANVEGAIDAALELSSSSRADGENPVTFMFAGLSDRAYAKVQDAMDKRRAVMPRRVVPDDAPTPIRKVRELQGNEEISVVKYERQETDSSLSISDD